MKNPNAIEDQLTSWKLRAPSARVRQALFAEGAAVVDGAEPVQRSRPLHRMQMLLQPAWMAAVPVCGLALSLLITGQTSFGDVAVSDTRILPANVYERPSLAAYLADSHSRLNPKPVVKVIYELDPTDLTDSPSRLSPVRSLTFDSTNQAEVPSSSPLSTGN